MTTPDVREKIKARIKKLLNLADDNGAFDGEITAAMLAAERLMDEYHLSEAEVQAAEIGDNRCERPPPTMGQTKTTSHYKQLMPWEIALGTAINELVGTTEWYRCRNCEAVTGLFKKPVTKSGVAFFGPEEDAQTAASLFTEWQGVIATLAAGKYGRCDRADGGSYAYGFACALRNTAGEANRRREHITTAATTALVKIGSDRSLAALHHQTRALALTWLERELGHPLRKGGRTRSGYRAEAHSAFAAGQADGSRADFTTKRTFKLTG